MAASAKPRDVPKPLVIRRPMDEPEPEQPSASFDDWARALNGE